MPNPLRKPVTVEAADGSTHTIRFTLNAMCEFEESTKQSVVQAFNKADIPTMRLLLWAGLLHEGNNYTVEQVGDMFELEDLKPIFERLTQKMKGVGDRPTIAAADLVVAVAAAESTGDNSGPSADITSDFQTQNSGS